MLSLSQFCKIHNLSKSTVWQHCKDHGIPTSEGLSPDAVELLKTAFGVFDCNQPKDQPDPAGSLQVIQPGTQYLDAPHAPTAVDLAQWGFQPVHALQDPVAVAEGLIAAIDGIERGLDDYISHLQSQAQTTQRAANQLADRRRLFERKADKASILATMHQNQLDQAQQAMASEAAALGKSSAA